jgi:hypothetical protein
MILMSGLAIFTKDRILRHVVVIMVMGSIMEEEMWLYERLFVFEEGFSLLGFNLSSAESNGQTM